MTGGATPLVSVVLMTYNHERYIAQALDSVLAQVTPFPAEVIVTEDRSTDRTAEIVRGYQRARPAHMRAVFSATNLNSNLVLQRAFAMARGRYVALLDGDDYWTRTDKLARQTAFLEADPGAAMCFHEVEQVDGDGRRISARSVGSLWPDRLGMADIVAGNHVPTCAAMVRRDAIQDLPSWYADAEFGDWPLWILAAKRGALAYDSEVMAARRVHPGGYWSAMSDLQQAESSLKMFELVASMVGPQWHGAVEVARAGWAVRLASLRNQAEAASRATEELRRAVLRHGIEDRVRQWFEAMGTWQSPRPWEHVPP